MKTLSGIFIVIGVIVIVMFSIFWNQYSDSIPPEPEGKPVVLNPEDLAPGFIKETKKEWYAWHRKGLDLTKEERYEEALYCYNRAIKAWPEKVKQENQRIKHRPEATDTYLQKAYLYLKMRKPKLALIYFEKFESYFPGNKYAIQGKKQAKEMLSKEN